MAQLLEYDKANPKIPRHKKPSSTDDEFETPSELYCRLIEQYQIFPKLDVAATNENKKCLKYFSKEDNALEQEWLEDSWCNHPHTLHKQFIEKCVMEHAKHNINILMIIPANCQRATYYQSNIENETVCFVENHPIKGSITFLKNGKPTKDSSRNAYLCIVWRKR